MKKLLTEVEGYTRLQEAIKQAGGAKQYARKLRCSHAFVSAIVNKRQRITGVVAEDLKLTTVKRYELTLIEDSPKQEQYVNQRAEYPRSVGIDPTSRKGIRGYE